MVPDAGGARRLGFDDSASRLLRGVRGLGPYATPVESGLAFTVAVFCIVTRVTGGVNERYKERRRVARTRRNNARRSTAAAADVAIPRSPL